MFFIRDCYKFSLLPNPTDLELLTGILQHHILPLRLCLSVFYRPPSSQATIFDDLCAYFESINCVQFANLVLVGDFNVDVATSSHPLFSRFSCLLSTLSLSQMVDCHTHVLPNNVSGTTIDLLLVSNPNIACASLYRNPSFV